MQKLSTQVEVRAGQKRVLNGLKTSLGCESFGRIRGAGAFRAAETRGSFDPDADLDLVSRRQRAIEPFERLLSDIARKWMQARPWCKDVKEEHAGQLWRSIGLEAIKGAEWVGSYKSLGYVGSSRGGG